MDREKWDRRYADPDDPACTNRPKAFLVECAEAGRLPDPGREAADERDLAAGRCVDLGGGAGANAVWLAERGWRVDLLDLSGVGLRTATARAREAGVAERVRPACLDMRDVLLRPGAYDLAINLRSLQRSAWPELIGCLRPGTGVLVIEAFLVAQVESGRRRPGNVAFTVLPGELREEFAELEELAYREEDDGEVAAARLCARKRRPGP